MRDIIGIFSVEYSPNNFIQHMKLYEHIIVRISSLQFPAGKIQLSSIVMCNENKDNKTWILYFHFMPALHYLGHKLELNRAIKNTKWEKNISNNFRNFSKWVSAQHITFVVWTYIWILFSPASQSNFLKCFKIICII